MSVSRETIVTCSGVGGLVAILFGGYDNALRTLLLLIAIDYITGILAASLRRSKKTRGGGLSSRAMWKGIVKKVTELFLVIMGAQLATLSGLGALRDCVIYALAANEGLSILENSAKCGVPIPDDLRAALEVLKGEKKGLP